MKQVFIVLALLTVFGTTVFAKQIDENTAKKVGQNFLSTKTNFQNLKNVANFELVYQANSKNSNVLASIKQSTFFYVFNAGSNGFVIIAGDDNVTPILGYSNQGIFDPNNMPKSVVKWLEGYKKEISYVIENNIQPSNEIIQEWQNLKGEASVNSNARSIQSVSPLLQTQWDQSPYYNALCPGGSVTGCVATAMAQIMKYWNYPATGSGFHSYNHQTYGTLSANFASTTYQWSSMPNAIYSSNNAVATLMYQVGVSVDMDYSPQSSGAYVISASSPVTNCSEYALKTYFGYKSTLQGVQRINYNQTQWLSLLKTELNASRPILYDGFGSGGGHCFVADGYDNNDYIHFNWGWDGAYDGYFQINALNPGGVGTGGGSGGYNSGHEAVIGIEPPSGGGGGGGGGGQTSGLALYNYVAPSASTIYYGQSFTVTTNIVNTGTNTFSGDYAAAIFDNSNNFIDYVQTLTGYSLQGGYAYSNNLNFSTTGLNSMLPGTYYIDILFRPTGGNWVQVANSGSYLNHIPITVTNSNDIELNSAIIATPSNTITQGQSLSVNFNVKNNGTTTFYGDYSADLYKLDGTFSQAIGSYNESSGLPSGYTYQSPYLTFSTPAVTVSPGTYLIKVNHKPNNASWELTGSTNFQNPITVVVVAAGEQADIYEVNNAVNQSYNLPLTFSGNNAVSNTTGSNCHITSDNDFYKMVLPTGYDYTITPRLHDSYNSGNGNTYSLDGLFSYSTDGSNWSDTYDDIISDDITLSNGGTVYIHVAPYFSGDIGTYLLSTTLTRAVASSINENQLENLIHVYPNPAKDFVLVDFEDFSDEYSQINLFNIQGQNLFSQKITDSSKHFNVPLTNLPEGIYFLKLQTNSGVCTKKIIVSK